MDYLDKNKQLRQRIVLFTGYALIAVAIVFATTVLLYQSYGFGIGKGGTVIQSGLTFFSSQPNPANIYINGVLKDQTNTRLQLPEGIYNITFKRDGYRDWNRKIEVDGGSVHHIDYPLLIPDDLVTKNIGSFETAPPLATQSPDRRWLLLEQAGSLRDFTVYDFKNAQKPVATTLSLPAAVFNESGDTHVLSVVDWASDNRHLLLKHTFAGGFEYILVDRNDPTKTINLTATLKTNPPIISLINRKYDQYYLYNQASGLLQSATLADPSPQTVLENVQAFKSYGDHSLLYATAKNAPQGKVAIRLTDGKQTYPIRTFDAGSTYLVDLTEYSGTLYVVAGSSGQNKVYIYRDPIGQLQKPSAKAVAPEQVLHVTNPNYVSFSSSAQFIVAESGNQFGVYDIENTKGYNYTTTQPIDAPQLHARWMDGNRLFYISKGKLVIFDYDNLNRQTLMTANSSYEPAFTSNYNYVYTLSPPAEDGKVQFQQTSLLIPADQ